MATAPRVPFIPPYGNTTKHNALTGNPAEITVNTETKTIHVHDGATPGGFPLAKVGHTHSGADVTGLATVASTGAYSDLTGAPAAYSLPVATASVLGGVKQGANISIAGDGTISSSAAASIATTTALLKGDNAGGAIAATPGVDFLTASSTSTLTNKTLTAPTINGGTLSGTLSGTATAPALSIGGNAATVTTNANLTGEVTSVGNATTVTNAAVIGKVLTGYVSGAGTVSASDSILTAIQKLNGNVSAGTASASALTGTTLAPNVVNSSLTSVGTLANLFVGSVGSGLGTVTTSTITSYSNGSPYGLSILGTAGGSSGGVVNVAGGSGTNNGGAVNISSGGGSNGGANVTITGGDGTSSAASGGSVIIASGSNTAGVNGALTFKTGSTQRLSLLSSGAWSVGTDAVSYGTSGQVLTSNGSTSSPTWQAVVAGAAAAGTLTGTTLASGVTASSLTSVGTLTGLTVSGTITGSVSGNAATVTTNANLTGEVTSTGNAATVSNAAVIGKVLTGFSAGSGTVAATDTILQAIQKVAGNVSLLTGATIYQGTWNASTNTPAFVSGTGTKGYLYKVSVAGTTSLDGNAYWQVGDSVVFDGVTWDRIEGGPTEVSTVAGRTGAVVLSNTDISGLGTLATQSGTFSGTHSGASSGTNTGDQTITLTGGVTGSGTGSFAATVVTNANLTGPVTSVGNATAIAAGAISNAMLANGAVANLSGTNTGDNAANTTYANDYRAANFVAGTNYLAPNGSAAALTGFPTFNQNTTGSAGSLANGTGLVTVNNASWGTITRPNTLGSNLSSGSATAHLWTDATGAGLAYLNSAGGFTASSFNGALVGNASTATTAGTVTTAAQPSITSVGTLTNLTVSGTSASSVTSNTASAAFTVTQTGTGNAFVVEDSSPDSTPFVIDANGNVGIGGPTATGYKLLNYGPWTGATTFYGTSSQGTIQSDVTSSAYAYRSAPNTVDAAFSLSNIIHYGAEQGTITGGSRTAPTSQHGFNASSGLIGATNNYGFYGNIPSGTGRYNLYMNGTADNYMAGNFGLGGLPYAGTKLAIQGNSTGSVNSYSIATTPVVQSDVTGTYTGHGTYPSTQATAFTLGSMRHFYADQGPIGAGSTVTNQYGFAVSAGLVGASNNYGFFGNIPAAAGRFNFYAPGTAQNAFAGNTRFGGTTAPTVAVDVTGAIAATGTVTGSNLSGTNTGDQTSVTGNAGSATNIAGGANGSLPYQTGSGATTFLAPGTNTHVLTLTGGVPTWAAPAAAGGLTTTDDTTTNATYYPTFVTAIAGSTAKMSSTKLTYNPSTGNLAATTMQSLSDERSKTNVVKLDSALSVVQALNGVSFDWIDGTGSSYGFIAQRVAEVLPHAVSEDADKMTLNYSAIIPFLVESIKAQQAQIEELTATVNALKKG